MTDLLSFFLGGVTVSFQSTKSRISLLPSKQFKDFIYSGSSDVVLKVHLNPFYGNDLGTVRFVSDNWILRDFKGTSVFQLRFTNTNTEVGISTLLLNDDGESGDLFTGKKYGNLPGLIAQEVPPYIFDGIITTSILAHRRGLMLHACGIICSDKQGLVFAGISGAGKTTTASIWQVAGAVVLSDERVAVRKQDGQFLVFGTPWHGIDQSSSPESAPLRKVFIIHHAASNHARRLRPAEAIALIMARAYLPFWDKNGMEFTLEFLDELCQTVPVYELGFIPGSAVVDFVKSLP